MFCHCEPVRLSGVAIPRLEEKCIDNCPTEQGNAGIYGGNRHLAPFNRGIATPVCALARNDSVFSSAHFQTPICRHAVKSDGHVLFPKNIPGISARDVGGLCLCGLLFASLSRLVRAKADTARLMRGKTTFLYWGFPTFVGLKPQKEKAGNPLCPNQKFPTSADFS